MITAHKITACRPFALLCRCILGLTGAGPRSQRGLESPGAEVGRCSLKDEGDRQGDKHGPLSTWGSSIVLFFVCLFFVFFALTSLLLLLRLPSVSPFFGLSSSAFLPAGGEGCFEAVHCLLSLPPSLCLFGVFLSGLRLFGFTSLGSGEEVSAAPASRRRTLRSRYLRAPTLPAQARTHIQGNVDGSG